MDKSGLLKIIFPDLYANKNISFSFRILDHLEKLLSNPKQVEAKPLKEIKKILLEKPQLIKLGSMFYPLTKKSSAKKIGSNRKTKIAKILAGLRVSNADIDFIGTMISCSHSVANTKLNFKEDHSCRLEFYQFIHQNEQGLIPGLFLHLANRLNLPAEKEWRTDLDAIAVRSIFDFYFRTYLPAKRKKPLLNGNDIQDISKIKPSPTFATILYKIEEARVLGVINTRSQAISFAKNIVRKIQKETN